MPDCDGSAYRQSASLALGVTLKTDGEREPLQMP